MAYRDLDKKREYQRNRHKQRMQTDPEYRERVQENKEKWRKNHLDHYRRYYRTYSYNITEDEYQRMQTEQNGKCLLCGKMDKLQIDHDHETGKVRGLLCSNCNSGLGKLMESPKLLREAANYIEKNRE